jgi:hypothetical protein
VRSGLIRQLSTGQFRPTSAAQPSSRPWSSATRISANGTASCLP